jgi:hypothetical protein
MFLSKEQVRCFYCDWNGRKDKAKDHCKKQHLGKTFKLKIGENNMEKFFLRQINRDTTTKEQVSTVVSPSLSSLNTSHVPTASSASVFISPTTNSIPDQLAPMLE